MDFRPDWTMVDFPEELERKIGNGFAFRIGWTITKTDTFFTTKVKGSDNIYRVAVWNRPTAYDDIRAALEQPIYRE